MNTFQSCKSPACQNLLSQGIAEFEKGRADCALGFFKQAAVAALGSAEPWFWMGRIREDAGDVLGAAHCFFMAYDMEPAFVPAKDALRRLSPILGDQP